MTETGEPFPARYAMVITVRDGCIPRSRDYAGPVAGARPLGRLPELQAALSQPIIEVNRGFRRRTMANDGSLLGHRRVRHGQVGGSP
jgi:hypothetical protein